MSYHDPRGPVRLPDPFDGDRRVHEKSNRNCVSQIVVRDGVLCVSTLPDIWRVRTQRMFRYRDERGEWAIHYADIVTEDRDGHLTGHAVRPKAKVTPEYRRTLSLIARHLRSKGDLHDFRLGA